ncbi:MAG: asparagine synthase (glutamine-hydrolyzing) [Vicinamibacteria bacterium]|nr:asparagine synthase (glutamine-hydrolyzing) [Vicinamibacteria bacterium]
MCGIAGAFRPGGARTSDATMARMRDRIAHRGPDGAGLWRSRDGSFLLAHRRLSIIDLSEAASQPMWNERGDVTIIFNGELYNHAEVRKELEALGRYTWKTDHSDTEALLHAYEEWGLPGIEKFFGMFAVAICDERNAGSPRLHLVRDRVGIKPMYLTRTSSGEWLFASEIKALLEHEDVKPEMDLTALWHYFTFIVAPAPLTLFRGIFKIAAGHRVTIEADGRARATRYWDCKPDASRMFRDAEMSDGKAVDELERLLRKSVERRMVSDVPFGVLLSGGVDSSLNVALMAERMNRPVDTFSVGYEDEESYNEFTHARRVSGIFKTAHHEVLIKRKEAEDFLPRLVELQDEPIADNVCIPLYFLSELVKKSGTTVVQVGEGSDENFLGYWWCEHYRRKDAEVYRKARQKSSLFQRLLGRSSPLLSDEDREFEARARKGQELFWGGAACFVGRMRDQLTPDPSLFTQAIDCPVEGLLPDSHRALDSHAVVSHYLGNFGPGFGNDEILAKIPYMEMKLRLSEHLLMRVDKLTMAHAVEARVPFLDHEVVEFAARLPARYKLRDGVGKWVVKKVAERHLPADLVYRKKQGFGAPMEEWFKDPGFGKRCVAAWERSQFRKLGLIDDSFVDGLLKAQTEGGGGRSFQLWTILNAVLWHERWISKSENFF